MDHMVKLSLSSNLLSGSIPTEIGKLSLCRFLDLCKWSEGALFVKVLLVRYLISTMHVRALANNHLSGPPPNITELVLVEEVYLGM